MHKFWTAIFVSLALSSCSTYLPQTADIPLIDHKNDLRIDAGYTASYGGGTTTISYGLLNKLSVQVYGTTDFHKRFFYHGALGYYKKLPNDYVLELYGGVGNGDGFVSNHDSFVDYYADYMEYFTQFNYGKNGGSKSAWDYGFGLKTGFLHSKVNVDYDENFYLEEQVPEDYSYITDDFILEPAIFFRVGGENLKFGLKATGLITPLNNPEYWQYFPINIAFTLNVRLLN